MEDSKRRPKLPMKQILTLAICRIAEPIALTSVFPYLPEMIESFNVPKNNVAKWAGIASASFSLSQAVTGILWGRASDRWGRKPTILLAVICAMFSSLLFGFSNSLAMAIVARSLAGATNGNVGTYRTVVAEMIPEKELQPRAFSIMPLVFTMGSIFGPALGGALANPAANYPSIFGNSAFFKRYPYALPNIALSVIFMIGLTTGTLFLKESLESKKHNRDYGRVLGRSLVQAFGRAKSKVMRHADSETTPLLKNSRSSLSTGGCDDMTQSHPQTKRESPPTYRELFTRQTSLNLIAYTFLALHAVAYDQLLPIFLHYPPQENRSSNPNVHLPFKFSGGFGLNAERIGLIYALYGICGMSIQFLIFPAVARRFGVLNSLKLTCVLFPISYLLTPFSVLLPTPLTQQIVIFLILLLKCWAVIFAFPCMGILLTNSAVSLRVLGTLNGVATSISAVGRAIGPAIEGWTFSVGLNHGYVILPWWTLSAIAALGAIPVWYLVEMEGFATDDNADPENDDPVTSESRPDTNEAEGQSRAIAIQRRHSEFNGFATDESGMLVQPGSVNAVESPLAMHFSSPMGIRRRETS
ncbi:hypothetical protein MMC22_009820 [Lobaria immixta]|nr:hypothetical protein [Lobaria immixta]